MPKKSPFVIHAAIVKKTIILTSFYIHVLTVARKFVPDDVDMDESSLNKPLGELIEGFNYNYFICNS